MNTTRNQWEPRIYVACLASYNAGHLHGKWIDLEGKDGDEVMGEIQRMLKDSPEPGAEEWAIHDYEDFGGLRLSESEDIVEVVKFARLVAEHGEAYAEFAGYYGTEYATAEVFAEVYQGCYESEKDWAEEFLSSTGSLEVIPEHLRYYFDFEAYARDAGYSGDVVFCRGSEGVHVYWSR